MNFKLVRWGIPVAVAFPDGREREFESVNDTLDFLENDWPGRAGRHWVNAQKVLTSALMNAVPAEAAREAFIAACIEANILKTYGVVRVYDRTSRQVLRAGY